MKHSELIKIAIVDDDENILKSLKRFFSTKEGTEIITFSDPLEAISYVKNDKVHIMLVDIQMPQMNGLEVLRRVKEEDPLVQVIIMTAYSSIERVIRAFELGANDFILKPFESLEHVWKIVELSIEKIVRWKKILGKTIEAGGKDE